jgi:hypothetical protein
MYLVSFMNNFIAFNRGAVREGTGTKLVDDRDHKHRTTASSTNELAFLK